MAAHTDLGVLDAAVWAECGMAQKQQGQLRKKDAPAKYYAKFPDDKGAMKPRVLLRVAVELP